MLSRIFQLLLVTCLAMGTSKAANDPFWAWAHGACWRMYMLLRRRSAKTSCGVGWSIGSSLA
jgi:threonine/homoserine efflux transporter RhtA